MFCVTEHLRHIACSVMEINMFTGFERDHYLQNDEKQTLLQSTKDILNEAIIIFHVFMRKPVL